jgi:hypothetical protein
MTFTRALVDYRKSKFTTFVAMHPCLATTLVDHMATDRMLTFSLPTWSFASWLAHEPVTTIVVKS